MSGHIIKCKSYGKYLKYVGKQIRNLEILDVVIATLGVKNKFTSASLKYRCLLCGNLSVDRPNKVLNVKKSCGCNRHRFNKRTENWSDDRKLRNKIIKVAYDQHKRCNSSKHKAYKYYGKRGIQFKFKSVRHAVDFYIRKFGEELKRKPNLSIDRIDNNGHYEPGNVRLATKSEQNLNTQVNAAA